MNQTFPFTHTFFVFPSEVVARSMLRSASEHWGLAQTSQFLSWDAFIECYFIPQKSSERTHQTGKNRSTSNCEANRLLRAVFAQKFLQKNSRELLLKHIVPPSYAKELSIHQQTIVSLLPQLPKLQASYQHSTIASRLRYDIEILYQEYTEFLTETHRYEPSWPRKEIHNSGNSYSIYFANCIEDFWSYKDMLEDRDEITIGTISPFKKKNSELVIQEFDDYRQEIDVCLSTIALLLQNGVHADQIAITLADYEKIYPRLEYSAKNYGIPLNRRKGNSLLSYPSLSWLAIIARGDYSFNSVRELILHPGLPWKNPQDMRELLKKAIHFGIVEGTLNRWKSIKEGRPFFDSLASIGKVESVEAFRSAVYRFLNTYVNYQNWSEVDESAWQRGLDLLQELGLLLDILPDMNISLDFILEQFEAYSYVSQGGLGIPVYEYGVSAGLNTDYHFCLNFHAVSTSAQASDLQFLGDNVLKDIFPYRSKVQKALLEAYSNSGNWVWMSSSKRVQGTATIPASIFLDDSHQADYSAVSEKESPGTKNDTAVLSDPELRGFPNNFDALLYAKNTRGLEKLLKSAKTLDLQTRQWPEIATEGLKDIFLSSEVSVSSVESWLHCPLGYFWQVLGLQALPLRPDIWPALNIGSLFHRIIEAIYRKIGQTSISPKKLEQYFELTDSEITSHFESPSEMIGIPIFLQSYLRSYFTDAIRELLVFDCDKWEGYSVSSLEFPFTVALDTDPVLHLKGRIDRIMQSPSNSMHESGLVLIDYKTGRAPSPKDILGELPSILPKSEEQKELGEEGLRSLLEAEAEQVFRAESIQLPAYSLALKKLGEDVAEVGYYAIREEAGKAYKAVLSPKAGTFPIGKLRPLPLGLPWLVDLLEESLTLRISEMQKGILGGDFRLNNSECPDCRFKSICRYKFALRID